MVIANILLNPLGTALASCFDERAFNAHILAIAALQAIVATILHMIPLIGTILNIPNWLFGIFLMCRVVYYNYRVTKQQEQNWE